MNKLDKFNVLKKKIYMAGVISLCLLIVFAFFLYGIVGGYGKNNEKKSLIFRVSTGAAAFNPSKISQLQGNEQDIHLDAYKDTRKDLLRILSVNSDARFVYLMGKKGDKIVFYADAEPKDSEDFSPPGQVYLEASPELVKIFDNQLPFVEGPLKDRWGEWVSAFAPIKDTETGQTVAVLGIDISAKMWNETIAVYNIFSLLITVFIALIIIMFFGILLYYSKVNSVLKAEINERKNTEEEKKELIGKLQQALSEVKVLSGFLPICASCKKIRDDEGRWNNLETYISHHSEAEFSHGICPDCSKILYPKHEKPT